MPDFAEIGRRVVELVESGAAGAARTATGGLAERDQPAPRSTPPAEVWVVVAVCQRVVAVESKLTTEAAPIGGPQGIFARRAAQQTTERSEAKIVAVAASEVAARLKAQWHQAGQPKVPYEYIIERHELADAEPVETFQVDAAPTGCIDCGVATGGATRCTPCQARFWESCRAADPEFAAAG